MMLKNKLFFSKQIWMLIFFVFALDTVHIVIFKSNYYFYLFWNIFLAVIPFTLSFLLLNYLDREKINKIIVFALFLLWFLFIPNAPYIITDLIHLGRNHSAPAIFDSIMVFSSALVGLVIFTLSMVQIEKIVFKKYPKKVNLITTILIFFISFGVYLGRFLRLNSWDVFFNPHDLFKSLKGVFSGFNNFSEALIYTFLFFIFILLSFNLLKNLKKENELK